MNTELGVHDNWVVEGLADGYIAVSGHDVEEHHLYIGKVKDREYRDCNAAPEMVLLPGRELTQALRTVTVI